MAGIQANGIGSGLDINGLVAQLVSAEGAPMQQRITRHETAVTTKISALASLKGSLGAFKSALASLKSVDALQARKATSGNTDLFAVSAGVNAVAGHYDVEVVSLASAHQLGSAAFADGSASEVGYGTLTISVGAASFNVEVDQDASTLAHIRDAINAASSDKSVQATLLNGADGARLVLTSKATGAAGAIKVAASGGDGGLSQLAYDPDGVMSMSELQGANDALIRIADFDVTSATNVFENAIDGVTITAKKAAPDEKIALDVAFDSALVQTRIQKFVSEYNSLQAQLSRLGGYNAETKVAGPMLGDSLLRSVQDQIRRGLTNPVTGLEGEFTTLASIGITTTASGTLEVDSAKLSAAVTGDAGAVASMFGSQNGVAAKLYDFLEDRLASDGEIESRNTRLANDLRSIDKDKEALALRLEQIQSRYQKQFAALDGLLSQMQSTSSYLAQQLANLPKIGER
jgi:flagellar hook-associated protein 2